jgi:hypothetical protein
MTRADSDDRQSSIQPAFSGPAWLGVPPYRSQFTTDVSFAAASGKFLRMHGSAFPALSTDRAFGPMARQMLCFIAIAAALPPVRRSGAEFLVGNPRRPAQLSGHAGASGAQPDGRDQGRR